MTEGNKKHSRGLICKTCKGNLKALFYYTQFGSLVRAEDIFYCDGCKAVVKVKQEVIGVQGE